MLIRAIDGADVTVRPMAFQADLLLRPRFTGNENRPIEVAEHGVIQLLYTVELGLEVSGRAGTNMAFDTCHLRVRGMLGSDKLRFHWHMTSLTAKIHRLGVLISFVTAEGRQKKESNSTNREQREDSPVTFAGQIDLKNTMLLFNLCRTALLTSVEDGAQKCEREPQ